MIIPTAPKNESYQKPNPLNIFIFSLVILLLVFGSSSFANYRKQQNTPELKKGMYVIVGVFSILDNAQKFTDHLKHSGHPANYGLRPDNSNYYVYLFYTPDDLLAARAKRTELRGTHEFRDAWILYHNMPIPSDEQDGFQEISAVNPPPSVPQEEPQQTEVVEEPPVQTTESEVALGKYKFLFNVTSATTLKEVPGYITVVDAERNKVMTSVPTNEEVELEAPNSASKKVIILCDVFGYVKQQVEFPIDDPLQGQNGDMVSKNGDLTTVKFELARHKAGDVLTMYNVYFYNDAAIMKPESTFELNSLLDMLKENENLTIKIHGHTNGNAPGKIIKLKDDDNNFFQITDNDITGYGSAKELSKDRAETIKRWLVDQGISEKRMTLKGWGGKKMIYKKTDALAKRNVRVEIEILKD